LYPAKEAKVQLWTSLSHIRLCCRDQRANQTILKSSASLTTKPYLSNSALWDSVVKTSRTTAKNTSVPSLVNLKKVYVVAPSRG